MTASRYPRRRNIVVFVLGLVAVLIVMEAVARRVEATGAEALRWYDASTQLRIEQMEERGSADVVFAGTSMAWQGLVPSVWHSLDPAGRDAFNVGLAGGVPQVMEPWLLDEVQPRLQPQLVVWGLSSLDFATSYGDDNLRLYEDALEARRGALARLEQISSRYSALVRYRSVLRDPNEWGEGRGFAEARRILGQDGERRDFEVDRSAARRRQIEARVTDFALDPADIEAIHRTVETLRSRGVEVAFVQMPVPARFAALHPNGARDVELAASAIRRLGDLLAVDVVDARGGYTDSDFVDFTHLDEASAAELTTRVVAALSGQDAGNGDSTVSPAELVEVANELAVMADFTRSALTQDGSQPGSSELWKSPMEYGRARDLWAYAAQGVEFHTVFTGSSLVYAGLDPAVYEAETGLAAYNAALPAAGPEELAAFLEDLVLPAARPQRIIFGLAPRDFATVGTATFCGDDLADYLEARSVREAAFAAIPWFEGVPTHSLLLGSPVLHEPPHPVPMHFRYRNAFSLLGDRTRYPTLNKKRLAEAEAILDERQSQYMFCGDRLEALQSLIADLTERGIEVVVVAMPVSSFRVDPLPGGRGQMEEIMDMVGVAALDAGASQYLDFKDLLSDDQFYDLTHPDLEASHQLTRAVAAALR